MNTPTPFERFGLPSVTKRVLDKKHTCQIISQGNGIVADVFGKTQQETLDNAELIVRAVNYHDRLVNELKTLKISMETLTNIDRQYWVERIQQLLTEIEKSK